jgi:hypothetical protein
VRCSEVICPKFNIFFASPWCFSANKRGIENDIGVSIPCGGRFDGGEAGFNIFFTSPWCFSTSNKGLRMVLVFLYHVVGDLTEGKLEIVEFLETKTVESASNTRRRSRHLGRQGRSRSAVELWEARLDLGIGA